MVIIVSAGISKDVVRVKRWQGRIIVAWIMMKKQLVRIIYVCEPETGRADTDKMDFREELERIVGLVVAHVITCIAGGFNRHVGTAEAEEESIGGFGWGTRSRAGREFYKKQAGRGRNILQKAGMPQYIE